jgi:kumamolisin
MKSDNTNSRVFRRTLGVTGCALTGAVLAGTAWSASAIQNGVLFHPASNTRYAADVGKRAHTFLEVVKPDLGPANLPGYTGGPPYSGLGIETPASLLCDYAFTVKTAGCNPNSVTNEGTGGSKMIAIVDAYDYSDASSDLATYSTQFGLPPPRAANFQVVYATGVQPPSATGTGWDLEEALDIEMAHSLAPKAKVVLVEAASSSNADMFTAVTVAAQMVQAAGGGEVSMSWGGSEFSGESAYDTYFSGYPNVVFYAASGDAWGTIYPCMSPDVVCVGGTANQRNPSTLALEKELTWSVAGAGLSSHEATPAFQSGIGVTSRAAPDVSAIADPKNGVWVYNCTYQGACYWFQVGGTSVATPVTASLDNRAGDFSTTSTYLSSLYSSSGSGRRDVGADSGFCGPYYSLTTAKGWDICTGWGTPFKE